MSMKGRQGEEKKRQSPHLQACGGEDTCPASVGEGWGTAFRWDPLRPGAPADYQGHESVDGLPGARECGRVTRGTRVWTGYQGHET